MLRREKKSRELESKEERVEEYRSVTKKEQQEGVKEIARQGKENLDFYQKLVEKLCDQIEVAELQWRHYNTALTMLCGMLRHDVGFPLRAAAIFTENLIHENLLVRKASLHVVDCLMKKTKRPHPKIKAPLCLNGNSKVDSVGHDVTHNGDHKVNGSGDDVNGAHNGHEEHSNGNALNGDLSHQKRKIKGLLVKPGEREDNGFLQYGGKRKPTTEQEWEAPRFGIFFLYLYTKTLLQLFNFL